MDRGAITRQQSGQARTAQPWTLNRCMARVELTPEVVDGFHHFFGRMSQFEVEKSSERISRIIHAIQILTHSPLIGRPAKGGNGELVTGQGRHGYIALYRFVPRINTAFVLAIRRQREAHYKHPR
jgi:toxin ParE1/3/4